LPDLIREENGWLVQPGDYERFASHIDQLAIDPNMARQMKNRARQFAETNLNARNMLTKYVEAANAVLLNSRQQ
jgi:glycosyltransferase involved in cell wall biosynthesis